MGIGPKVRERAVLLQGAHFVWASAPSMGSFRSPDLGARSSSMIFSAQRTWGRRTDSHALRNFAPSGNPTAISCRGRRQPHRGGAGQISGRTFLESSVGFARRASREKICVSWVGPKVLRRRARRAKNGAAASALERASAIGRYRRARVSTINGWEVSPGHERRHPELFDTGRQIIPPPAVSGRRFAGAGPGSTVRPARQACRSVDEKFRPAEPEQSSRSWRTWLRRSHGPSFATRP
jgi:hypothetical protein